MLELILRKLKLCSRGVEVHLRQTLQLRVIFALVVQILKEALNVKSLSIALPTC